jgi:predicted nucleic acid-binding protein
MSGRFFLDTNIAIYAVDSGDAGKQKTSLELLARARSNDAGWLSYQVVQEWFNVVLVRSSCRLTIIEAEAAYNKLLEPLNRVESSRDLITAALSLHSRERLSWWDSLIVAAAVLGRCDTLLTEDLQHGQVIRGVRIENPFL